MYESFSCISWLFFSLVTVSFASLFHCRLLRCYFPCILFPCTPIPDFVSVLRAPSIGVIPVCNATIPCNLFSSAVITIQCI
ncbi:hypothetical protein F4604DRAFT_1772270 [Suillus subluteus]|nr:hypothetical protein F4604DRAFT_1772270 [Suillus subluteus]